MDTSTSGGSDCITGSSPTRRVEGEGLSCAFTEDLEFPIITSCTGGSSQIRLPRCVLRPARGRQVRAPEEPCTFHHRKWRGRTGSIQASHALGKDSPDGFKLWRSPRDCLRPKISKEFENSYHDRRVTQRSRSHRRDGENEIEAPQGCP